MKRKSMIRSISTAAAFLMVSLMFVSCGFYQQMQIESQKKQIVGTWKGADGDLQFNQDGTFVDGRNGKQFKGKYEVKFPGQAYLDYPDSLAFVDFSFQKDKDLDVLNLKWESTGQQDLLTRVGSGATTGDAPAAMMTPTDSFKAFWAAIGNREKDPEALRKMISDETLTEWSASAGTRTLDEVIAHEFADMGEGPAPDVRNEKIMGEAASIEFKDDDTWMVLPLLKESGQWKVDWIHVMPSEDNQTNTGAKLPANNGGKTKAKK